MESALSGGVDANAGDIILMVGTRKGAFLLRSDKSRRTWSVSGPHHAGSDVFHMAYDGRNEGVIFAAINSPIWGPEIQRSHDLGATWRMARRNPRFAAGRRESVERVWHIGPGRPAEPTTVYAGVSPAALFRSVDGGDSWSEIESLTAHPDPRSLATRFRGSVPPQHRARSGQCRPHVGGDISRRGVRH